MVPEFARKLLARVFFCTLLPRWKVGSVKFMLFLEMNIFRTYFHKNPLQSQLIQFGFCLHESYGDDWNEVCRSRRYFSLVWKWNRFYWANNPRLLQEVQGHFKFNKFMLHSNEFDHINER